MAAPPMDPQYEQRLRDEVIYLHSLWHQGPPRSAASSSSAAAARHHRHLQPSNPTQFKKEKKQKGKRGTNNPNVAAAESNPSPGVEWPIPSPPPPPSTDGWPEAKPNSNRPPSLSPEEKSKLAAKNVHHRALQVVLEYFRYNNADDDPDSIDSSSDEDGDLMDEDDGREEYTFFFKVFKEDNELREYYEKNYARGEFVCLVCGALGGRKMGKKFKGCLALVQHSITIAKTKKRKAHRAFGQAVCKILGWDINELSSIVSLLSDKSGETQGNGSGGDNKESSMAIVDNVDSIDGNIVEGKNDEAVPGSESIGTGILPNSDEGDMNGLTRNDADKSLQDLGMVNNVEEPPAEALTDCIGGGDKETLSDIVDNVPTLESEALESKNDEAVPESGAIGPGILGRNGDEGDMTSLTCADADKSVEDLGMVHPLKMEEPAVEDLTYNSLTCTDADQNVEKTELMLPRHLEEPTSEGLTFNSLTRPVADQNLENIGMVLPRHLEEPTAEGLIPMVPFNENNGAGNEMQNLQMDNAFLNWLN